MYAGGSVGSESPETDDEEEKGEGEEEEGPEVDSESARTALVAMPRAARRGRPERGRTRDMAAAVSEG